jgi:uncharacterized membrane protein YeiH
MLLYLFQQRAVAVFAGRRARPSASRRSAAPKIAESTGAGGVIRDVRSAEMPLILRKGQLYASAAIAGAVAYIALSRIGAGREGAALAGMAVTIGLRLLAIFRDIHLPVVAIREE